MKRILVLGAGRSATALIDYLINHAKTENWNVVVADRDLALAKAKVEERECAEALLFDVMNEEQRKDEINKADFVISLLPPSLHILVAKDCVQYQTNLGTASYVSPAVQELNVAAKKAGVLLMNELGADPGIDHMSAMEIIDRVRDNGGVITSFQSYCGGLIAKESDDNPWHYKVSWNPWNIVRAGSDGADFIMNNETYHRPYEELYKEYSTVEVDGYGTLGAYANRDSLAYIKHYQLDRAHTVLRATLRHPDFMEAWAVVIALNLTNTKDKLDVTNLTYNDWFLQSAKNVKGDNLNEKLKTLEVKPLIADLIHYLGLDANEKIGLKGAVVSAKVLQQIIETKWKLNDADKDLLVFHHDIEYEQDGLSKQIESSLLVTGENQIDTAMAKCVGLPLAIFAHLFLKGTFEGLSGVQIPTNKIIYGPILERLKDFGVQFHEKEQELL